MANPNCPAGCAAPLPIWSFDDCTPDVRLSEIEWIIVGAGDTPPFTSITSLTEWNERLSNTATTAGTLRRIRVIGDMPAPTDSEVTISGARQYVLQRTFTVNADIDEANQINYDAVRMLQCGGNNTLWFVTRSGDVFGGVTGIKNAQIKGNLILGRGDTEFQKFNLVITWKDKFMPERAVWPLAGSTGGGEVTYDTTLTFAAATTDTDAGVTGTVAAVDPNQKFEFQAITGPSGTPTTMTIKVSAATVLTVDFPSDYLGHPFRYTHTDNTPYTGVFTNGDVNF